MSDDYTGKYRELTAHLEAAEFHPVCMTFMDIERVLGFPLPKSARMHQAWWANQPRGQSLAWTKIGWRTSALSLNEERLTFIKPSGDLIPPEEQPSKYVEKLTINEAKERLAATFGVQPSQIEITIKA